MLSTRYSLGALCDHDLSINIRFAMLERNYTPSLYISLQLIDLKEILKGFQCPLPKAVKADLFASEPVPVDACKALHDPTGWIPNCNKACRLSYSEVPSELWAKSSLSRHEEFGVP